MKRPSTPNSPPPTQLDIAHAAGVGRSTVSMALINHPSIPEKTRRKIQKIASKLGYVPDAMLSALASYRHNRRTQTFQGTLAWLTNYTAPSRWSSAQPYALFWKDNRPYRMYYEGALAQAHSRGYQLEVFELKSEGMTPDRMASILYTRNIRGILVCPPPASESVIRFPWEKFSALTFGYSLTDPSLHTVGTSQYRAMLQTMQHVHACGYKRIAFAFSDVQDQRANHNYLAGYLSQQHLAGLEPIFPPFPIIEEAPEQFRHWLKEKRPEVIVTGNENILTFLSKAGIRVPQDVFVASTVLSTPESKLTGFCEGHTNVGSVAVDFLIGMILRNERGVPKFPQHVHVEGSWVRGKTLSRQSRSKSK